MNHFLVIKVFDWKGSHHVTVDRVLRVAGRRHAGRERVWGVTVEAETTLTEYEAICLVVEALTPLMRKG